MANPGSDSDHSNKLAKGLSFAKSPTEILGAVLLLIYLIVAVALGAPRAFSAAPDKTAVDKFEEMHTIVNTAYAAAQK